MPRLRFVKPHWCVRDPMGGKAVVVVARDVQAAIKAGTEALIDDFPADFVCEFCEHEAVLRVEVFKLGEPVEFRQVERWELVRAAAD